MNNFNTIYENLYQSVDRKIEQLRKKIIATLFLFVSFVVIELILAHLIKYNTLSLKCYILSSFLSLIIICILIIIIKVKVDKYKAIFKETVIKKFISEYDKYLGYLAKVGISEQVYKKAEFIENSKWYTRDTMLNFMNAVIEEDRSHYIYSSKDYIEGKIEGVGFLKMAEVHTYLASITHSDNDMNKHTIFRGLFANIEMSKSFNNNVYIFSTNILKQKIKKTNFKIDINSEEFNQYFDVYTRDKLTVMEILTPDILDLLIKYRKKYNIHCDIIIKDKNIYIRFKTGKIFEPRIFKEVLNYNDLKKYFDIIDLIFRISNLLNK